MRQKILISATLATIVCSLAPRPAHAHGETVAMKESFMPGTIVVRTGERHLYYVTGYGQAIRYPVGVGRAGKQWAGTSYINGKYIRPDWSPPAAIRRDKPNLPKVIRGGSPGNPMGFAAMSLGRICDSWYESAGLDRPFRFLWLHPYVQRGHQGPVRPRRRRHAGCRTMIGGQVWGAQRPVPD
jgi:hypothetical protein